MDMHLLLAENNFEETFITSLYVNAQVGSRPALLLWQIAYSTPLKKPKEENEARTYEVMMMTN